ncbi:Craniofacial development protein 2 [Varanus komodoensis]|nr:Craniofacial development protein 2 [Varanus komodoensis]
MGPQQPLVEAHSTPSGSCQEVLPGIQMEPWFPELCSIGACPAFLCRGEQVNTHLHVTVRIQGNPFNITIVQAYAPTTGAEEAEVDQFCEGLQHLLELTPKNGVLIIMGDLNTKVTNRFKELDLIDRVPEKLWTEVRNIVQEVATKTVPMKKKCKKAKWLSQEALQIAAERREAKGKGERERYTQLNAEFQRTARRDKNAFFNEQCKEIEENNRIGRTRDFFKKIGDMKGTFHAKMGMIKDQKGRDLTEAEEIKKRWQDYTEELYKKELNVPDNHDGVVTDLKPDILECEVKWALGSLNNSKASGDNTTLMAESEGELKSLLMWVKEESAKVGLKRNIKKTKIVASGPLTSWQIDGEEMEVVTDFIFLGSKIASYRDCSQEIKRRLLLGRKAMANLDSILKSRDITLPTKVRIVKAMFFPVAICVCKCISSR